MEPNVKIFIATDHTGFALKIALIEHLRQETRYEVVDMGAHELDPDDDYPDLIDSCAKEVAKAEQGRHKGKVYAIIIGGTGEGEAMVANRLPGIRAAVFYGQAYAIAPINAEGAPALDGFDIVRLARLHNNANVLSLGARFVSEDEAKQAIGIFLETEFTGDERHVRRISKF